MTTAPAFRTAERRTRGARPRLPSQRAVLIEQIRATGFALRSASLIGVAIIVLITVVGALQRISLGPVIDLYEWPTLFPGLMGAVLPIAVWAGDERFGSSYLWTLPVDRRLQVLNKVLAGWVWLMGGVVLFAVWLLLLPLFEGGSAVPPETLRVITSPIPMIGPLDPATLRTVPWDPGLLIWAVPFTAATAIYLLASAFLLGSRRPLRWVIGIVLFYALLSIAGEAADTRFRVTWLTEGVGGALEVLVRGQYGLDALLTARTGTLSTTTPLTTGGRAMVWRGVPDLSDWRIATLLWTGVGLVALWSAASRHGERRRA